MIGLFYGSTSGHTLMVAEMIQTAFAQATGTEVELLDVADIYLDEMADFDFIIVGIPTWNVGQLQVDWQAVLDELDQVDLTGKQAALFGLGDQVGYPDTFVDAMIFLADRLEAQGARLVGAWPTTGYHFSNSWALRDDRFVGLVLDEDNQPELTPERVTLWVAQLVIEMGLAEKAGLGDNS
jgi:flavodoxin I